jgi:hypothetical protein
LALKITENLEKEKPTDSGIDPIELVMPFITQKQVQPKAAPVGLRFKWALKRTSVVSDFQPLFAFHVFILLT